MTHNRTLRRSVLAAIGAVVLSSTLIPATASADQPAAEPDSTQLVQPMTGSTITGIEPQAGGAVLATSDNGATITMTAEQYQVWLQSPAGQQFSNPGPSPQVVVIVPGNCGTSMITITSDGYNQAEILTGFDVFGDAVQYSWNIYMADHTAPAPKVGEGFWHSGLSGAVAHTYSVVVGRVNSTCGFRVTVTVGHSWIRARSVSAHLYWPKPTSTPDTLVRGMVENCRPSHAYGQEGLFSEILSRRGR